MTLSTGREALFWDRGMKRNRDDAKIIEMVNRCEELILKAKRAAREIEEKVRQELETLARHNSRQGGAERKAAHQVLDADVAYREP
jgi:hypothetical protein